MVLLQKIVGAFVDFPGIILSVCLLLGIRAGIHRRRAWGYALFALFLYLFSAGWVLLLLPRPSFAPSSSPPQAIVVFGGGVVKDPGTGNLLLSPVSLARVYRAFLLYRERPLPIIVSGGKLHEEQPLTEAEVAFEVLGTFGVPPEDVILEAYSRTTWENARYTAALLRALGIRSFYLVTSEVHLPRALLAFRKFYPEADITPCPAHPLLSTGVTLSFERFLPRAEVLSAWGDIIHEGVGYLLYLLKWSSPLGEEKSQTNQDHTDKKAQAQRITENQPGTNNTENLGHILEGCGPGGTKLLDTPHPEHIGHKRRKNGPIEEDKKQHRREVTAESNPKNISGAHRKHREYPKEHAPGTAFYGGILSKEEFSKVTVQSPQQGRSKGEKVSKEHRLSSLLLTLESSEDYNSQKSKKNPGKIHSPESLFTPQKNHDRHDDRGQREQKC